MIHPRGHNHGLKRAAAKGTQVTAENQGLAAQRALRDCNMFLANLSSAELGTRGVWFRELECPSAFFPEQLGMSEDPSSNFTLFLTSSVT